MLKRLSLILLILALSAPAWAQTEKTPRLLTVTGTGEVSARPDRAVVRLGIETQDKSLQNAQQENARIANAVVQRIQGLGVPERQIRTSSFNVSPIQEQRDPRRPDLPVTVGYRVVNIVSVRLDDPSMVGRVVDAALAAGANRVDNVFFELQNEEQFRQQALQEAAKEAQNKARVLAGAMGVKLGQIYSISEGGVNIIRPMAGAMFARAEAPTPILPGEVQLNASVSVAYVIE